MKEIAISQLKINPFDLIGKEWMLVTAGDGIGRAVGLGNLTPFPVLVNKGEHTLFAVNFAVFVPHDHRQRAYHSHMACVIVIDDAVCDFQLGIGLEHRIRAVFLTDLIGGTFLEIEIIDFIGVGVRTNPQATVFLNSIRCSTEIHTTAHALPSPERRAGALVGELAYGV